MNCKGKQNSEKIQRVKIRLVLGSSVIKLCKWDQKITSGLRYKIHVRIKSESYVRLMLGGYVIKPSKWNQKVTSELPYKNRVRITSGGYVRFTSGNYVIKPCKWEQSNT